MRTPKAHKTADGRPGLYIALRCTEDYARELRRKLQPRTVGFVRAHTNTCEGDTIHFLYTRSSF